MRLQTTTAQDQNGQREPLSSGCPIVVPKEGFRAVLEEYSEIIEKTAAQMEAELNDETSWDFIGGKDGVKAYTKVDGSLTAAKGVGFLPYHPRVIWDQFIDATKRKLVDHQLALGRKLKTLHPQTHIDYLEYKPIFVVAGRDFCNLVHWRVLPDGTIILVVQSIEDLELCPLKEPKVVRGDLHLACTKKVPNAAYDGAMVTTMVKTDIKGSIQMTISYYPAPTVDISCLVALGNGNDFGVCRLREMDKMNLQDVYNCLRGVSMSSDQGDRNKSMSLLPTWVIRLMRNVFRWLGGTCGVRIPQVGKEPFMFSSCMMTSVGLMGLDMAFSSITLYSQVLMLVNISSILNKAVLVNDKVEVRPMLTLTTTIDHQYANGPEVARMAKILKEFVENPSLLEVIHGA
ncbi:hypothetical protein DD237_004287 [Peronospora effusa]|uniref:dihydrolipoyllysine-residue succinyltransferase n=1 Tax=Peronospora effusa TaxID=542832 RepID=A0A3R7W0R4_9STRA|nr:hypothetical protein DD237_004287 [Peronospora effusa]